MTAQQLPLFDDPDDEAGPSGCTSSNKSWPNSISI